MGRTKGIIRSGIKGHITYRVSLPNVNEILIREEIKKDNQERAERQERLDALYKARKMARRNL